MVDDSPSGNIGKKRQNSASQKDRYLKTYKEAVEYIGRIGLRTFTSRVPYYKSRRILVREPGGRKLVFDTERYDECINEEANQSVNLLTLTFVAEALAQIKGSPSRKELDRLSDIFDTSLPELVRIYNGTKYVTMEWCFLPNVGTQEEIEKVVASFLVIQTLTTKTHSPAPK
jgi:hypothetical protein